MEESGIRLSSRADAGIGISTHTTIFSALDGLLLRPLPSPDAHRLAAVYNT
jgi:hypothetical protein